MSVFIVLNHRSKNPEKNGRTRFIFSITSIVSTRSRRFRRTVWTPDTLPPGVWKSIFLHRQSPALQSTLCSRLCSGCFPVCSADTWPRNFLLLLLRLYSSLCCWPDFYKLMECVLRILLFLLLAPRDIYIYCGPRVFSKLFAPKLTFLVDFSPRRPTET